MSKTELANIPDESELAEIKEPLNLEAGSFDYQTQPYCSFPVESHEDRVKLYNMINGSTERLADHINKTLVLRDVFIEEVNLVNEETGEVANCPRIVFMAVDGKMYGCVSFGILQAFKRLCMCFGWPSWNPGLTVEVKQRKIKEKNMLTLEVVK